jgi:hypothetical protein
MTDRLLWPWLALLVVFAAGEASAGPRMRVATNASASVLGNQPDAENSEQAGDLPAAASSRAILSAPITSTSNFLLSSSSEGGAIPGMLWGNAGAEVQSTHATTLVYLAYGELANATSGVLAEFEIDDVVVTPTEGGGAATVPAALNLELSGGVGAGASMNMPPELGPPASSSGLASVSVDVSLAGRTSTGTRTYFDNNRNEVSSGSTGILAGDDRHSTPTVDVPVGVPFRVSVSMRLHASAGTNVTHGNAIASGTFNSRLAFPQDRPVFTLPAGYTVDSPSAGIVDNSFPEPCPDADGDVLCDAVDNCPFHPSVNLADADHDGRGDVCECTDQNGDGLNTVADLLAINAAIFAPRLATPLCDGNGDGVCSVQDILAANAEVFSPTSTSICARQPLPGP